MRLNEKRRMSFKEKREFEQLEQEIADLETEKNAIEEALCSGTFVCGRTDGEVETFAGIVGLDCEKNIALAGAE